MFKLALARFLDCQRTWRLTASAFAILLAVNSSPASAERLRISPDDLRLRVAVSEVLEPSLRFQLKDLAHSVPLPLKDGLIQTEELLNDQFRSKKWTKKRKTLTRYYFLVARLDSSQKFSDEFLKRETVLRQGRELADDYIENLNRLIARAAYIEKPELSVLELQSFPMKEAKITQDEGLLLLHQLPKAELSLGRKNLKTLRRIASSDRDLIRERLKILARAERKFLDEVSIVGQALIDLRPKVRRWVKVPGEGLPFSR